MKRILILGMAALVVVAAMLAGLSYAVTTPATEPVQTVGIAPAYGVEVPGVGIEAASQGTLNSINYFMTLRYVLTAFAIIGLALVVAYSVRHSHYTRLLRPWSWIRSGHLYSRQALTTRI